MKKILAVVFGGKSDEHEVSLSSAANVLRAIDENKYEVHKIGITREGRWYWTPATPEQIADGSWEELLTNHQCAIPHDPTIRGILVFDMIDRAHVQKIDCIIPVLHGDHGEDGEIQGLFSMAEIPFVGPGVKASANCMDKSAAKELGKLVGVKMAKHYLVRKRAFARDRAAVIEEIKETHGGKYPLFVKPCAAGSSVGVTKVKSGDTLESAIEEALRYDSKVLVEEAIVGRELEVAVLGNESPKASSVGEILTAGEFYSYDSKYINPESKTRIADDLPPEVRDQIRQYAIDIYCELDCRGLSRVDFFYSDEGDIIFNEINTLPGFTDISMYPMLWRHDGIPTTELMDILVELALEEHSDWIY